VREIGGGSSESLCRVGCEFEVTDRAVHVVLARTFDADN
jgi:hypothetical protein